jgi:hypothetical protein
MPHPHPTTPIHLGDTPIPTTPLALLTLLTSHLPHSLPVLRRLQFAANFPGGSTPHTHVLYARHTDQEEDQGQDGGGGGLGRDGGGAEGQGKGKGHFAVACVDLSRAPETQVWVYSSLEGGGGVEGEAPAGGRGHGSGYHWEGRSSEEEAALDLVLAVFRRIRAIASSHDGRADGSDGEEGGREGREILVGSLHEIVRQGLLARGVGMDKASGVPAELDWEFCGKWLFRVEDLPVSGGDESLPGGMRWDKVRKGDVGVVQARTSIKRQE